MSLKISFQGELGAYSHQACLQYDPAASLTPCQTFEDAMQCVTEQRTDLAIIPVENSIYGRVADVHRLLPDSGLFIIAEEFVQININLLGHKEADLAMITQAAGHPVILPQCNRFLNAHNIAQVSSSDNAKAALDVSRGNDPAKAALASSLAAEIYGLKIIAQSIENTKNNTTRFFVMSHKSDLKSPDRPPHDNAPIMTSFIFRTRNIPAALYKALGGFATNGINMTKLESYMLDSTFSATQFYAEIEGQLENQHVQRAFDELSYYTDVLDVIGQFHSKKPRETPK